MSSPFTPLRRLLFILLCFSPIPGFSAPAADSAAHGFSAERLGRLDAVIDDHIARQQIAGAIMYIARDGQPVHLKTYGQREIETRQPMTEDTIFRIASMSKAVTTIATLMLYEEGRFMLKDPVSKYLPAFANSVVAIPPPAGAAPGTTFTTVPARHPITIRDLLCHTAGLTYGDGAASHLYKQARLHGWYLAGHDETLSQAIDRLATLPLHGHPGESWQYGFATDVLGRLVEVVSGKSLDRFIEERISRPLGLTDTCFFLPPEKASRLAAVYGLENGRLVLQETAAKSDYVHGPRKCFSGGAGLLSTVRDYTRILQLLLNEGELDGVRLLSPKTVQLMRANHLGDKYRRDADGFGLGFWVNGDLGFHGELSTEGAYGWGSAYFPQYVIDPKERLIILFMTQLRPAGSLDLNQKIKVLTYQALLK